MSDFPFGRFIGIAAALWRQSIHVFRGDAGIDADPFLMVGRACSRRLGMTLGGLSNLMTRTNQRLLLTEKLTWK